MGSAVVFDHVHLISEDPHATASWYVDKLGAEITNSAEVRGAPQVYLSFSGALVIVRGGRPGEEPDGKEGVEWGIDHFGLQVTDDLDGFCEELEQKGVRLILQPTDFNPTTRIAFIEAPDGVRIELLRRL